MPIDLRMVGSVAPKAGQVLDEIGKISASSAGSADLLTTDRIREYAAWLIGLSVIAIFGGAVFYLFHLAALLFTKFNGTNSTDFATFVRDSLDPFLKECATTLGTIFGSTLGFVFGYYFKATSGTSTRDSSA